MLINKNFFLKKSIGLVFICLMYNFSFTQEKKYNYDDLSPITIGLHNTNYNDPNFINNQNNANSTTLNLKSTTSLFLDYRVLKYKNTALKLGLFLNCFNNKISYEGSVYDGVFGEFRQIDNSQEDLDKIKAYELYLNLSHLLKIDDKLFLELNAGLSYEQNQSVNMYEEITFFADENFTPYQRPYYTLYYIKDKFFRYNFAPSVAYKTNYGLVNLGIKYSIPMKKLLSGQYEFEDPTVNAQDESYGVFNVSGKYLSFTLSFTPSKSLFKSKK